MSEGYFWKRVLIPALVFQSVIIAGGYATGRELVEFFLFLGPWAGLAGMGISALVWSVVCAVTFEFARRFHAYNYRDFFQKLLGRSWVVFEFSYLVLAFIVLGVIASSAGSILVEILNIPYHWGVLGISLYICVMVWRGSRAIERALSFWSVALYLVFGAFLVIGLSTFGDAIQYTFARDTWHTGWVSQGLAYAGYNLGLIPAVLFAVQRCQTRKQAISAGILAGVLTIIPGMAFFTVMCGFFPDILQQTVPSTYILGILNSWGLFVVFHFVLLGTITESGTSIIHAINQRIQSAYAARGWVFPMWARPVIAVICLAITYGLSQYGLAALIAKGYGTITWIIMGVYVVPLLTIGIVKLMKPSYEKAATAAV